MGDTNTVENCITHGPWVNTQILNGAKLGKEWTFMPQGSVKKISISYGEAINGIEFESDCSNDATQKSVFGSKSGNRTDTICFVFPNEYLTSIRGRVGRLRDHVHVVRSLCFVTNKNRYGTYGSDDMHNSSFPFSYNGKGGVIVGFFGYAGKHIDGIGIYVMPKSLALGRNHTCEEHSRFQKCCRMSRPAIPREVGPWGVSGGERWDHGVFSNVKKIHVHLGNIFSNVIFGIQIKYVKVDGKSIWSPRQLERYGPLIKKVKLDVMNEYLTGISGSYGPIKLSNGLEGITSITFHTNKKTYGPYGQNSGAGFIYFTSTSSPRKVVGFYGRDNGFLSAIGVHMEYF